MAEGKDMSRFKDISIEPPTKLTDEEKKLYRERFVQIKGILDDTCDVIIELDRDEAQRYFRLLVQGLQEADAKFGGSKPVADQKPPDESPERIHRAARTEPSSPLNWGEPLPPGAQIIERRPDGSRVVRIPMPRPQGLEFRRKTEDPNAPQYMDIVQGAPVILTDPPDFQGIFDALTSEAQKKARQLLDCVKDYFREDGPGLEVICRDCSVESIQECLRSADPSIDDILTHLIRAESERPR
jgi:hypothetical protein